MLCPRSWHKILSLTSTSHFTDTFKAFLMSVDIIIQLLWHDAANPSAFVIRWHCGSVFLNNCTFRSGHTACFKACSHSSRLRLGFLSCCCRKSFHLCCHSAPAQRCRTHGSAILQQGCKAARFQLMNKYISSTFPSFGYEEIPSALLSLCKFGSILH